MSEKEGKIKIYAKLAKLAFFHVIFIFIGALVDWKIILAYKPYAIEWSFLVYRLTFHLVCSYLKGAWTLSYLQLAIISLLLFDFYHAFRRILKKQE